MNILAAMIIILLVPMEVLAEPIEDVNKDVRVGSAINIVKNRLKDPDSAQFRSISIIKNTINETVVCGEYNARNSYGGYVGYKAFAVQENILSTSREDLERLGCYGQQQEYYRRKYDAEKAFKDKISDEAIFSCNVIWTLMENYFRYEQGQDNVINAAVNATLNRVKENGKEITPEIVDLIRKQYIDSLKKTEKDINAVKSIKNGDQMFEVQFIKSCTAMTRQIIELRSNK